jgi:hypothetical protein
MKTQLNQPLAEVYGVSSARQVVAVSAFPEPLCFWKNGALLGDSVGMAEKAPGYL